MITINHLKPAATLCLFLLFVNLYGQGGAGTSGGDKATDMYKVSYSVGQCFYTATTQSALYISSGIQHPFMLISIETDIQTEDVDPKLQAYPNPVKDWLRLKIDDPELTGMHYNLCNLSGMTVQLKEIESAEMIISMTGLPSGIYFLNVYGHESLLKTFKIIKQ